MFKQSQQSKARQKDDVQELEVNLAQIKPQLLKRQKISVSEQAQMSRNRKAALNRLREQQYSDDMDTDEMQQNLVFEDDEADFIPFGDAAVQSIRDQERHQMVVNMASDTSSEASLSEDEINSWEQEQMRKGGVLSAVSEALVEEPSIELMSPELYLSNVKLRLEATQEALSANQTLLKGLQQKIDELKEQQRVNQLALEPFGDRYDFYNELTTWLSSTAFVGCQIDELLSRFEKWRRSYAEDYSRANGNTVLSKLLKRFVHQDQFIADSEWLNFVMRFGLYNGNSELEFDAAQIVNNVIRLHVIPDIQNSIKQLDLSLPDNKESINVLLLRMKEAQKYHSDDLLSNALNKHIQVAQSQLERDIFYDPVKYEAVTENCAYIAQQLNK